MTLLGIIRKNSWLIISIIVLSSIAFVVDFKVFSFFFEKKLNIIGKINNQEIFREEYNNQINFQKKIRQDFLENIVTSQVWENLISEKLLTQKAKNLGIQFNEKNFWDIISKQSVYSQISHFQNKNGDFNIKKFKSYLSNLKKFIKNNYQASEEYKLWLYQKEFIPKQFLSSQYLEMILNGINITLIEAILTNQYKNMLANIDYIFIPYFNYGKNNKIVIKNKEILDYIKSKKSYYKTLDSRDINLVIFPNKASLEDFNIIKKQVDSLAYEFSNITNDSIFVSNYSEIPYNSNYYNEYSLPSFLKDFVNNANIGDVYGPIRQDNTFIIVKLTGKKMLSTSIKSSHILISYKEAIHSLSNRNKEEAKKTVEKFYNIIKADSSQFEVLAEKSDDIHTVKNKGSIGWSDINKQKLIPEYQNFLNQNSKNTIGIIETSFGYHIVRIDDKGPLNPFYQLAIILKNINPSKDTEDAIYKNAIEFIQNNNNVNQNIFVNNARKKGYLTYIIRNIIKSELNIKELNSDLDEKIVYWAFHKERNLRDTKLFTSINGSYIISYLSDIQQNGIIPIKKIKNKVISVLEKEKISKLFLNEIKKYSKKKLEELAEIFSVEVKKIDSFKFNNSIILRNGIEKDSEVIGTIFSLPLNYISRPIFTKEGIFILRVNKRMKINNNPNYNNEIQIETTFLQKKSINSILKALKDKVNIKDYRNESDI